LPEGTGRSLVIDANLIMGNSAESGSGGGVRLQMVNGQDVIALPARADLWNSVLMTNNIIANNVAGWDGGGVSMQDALKVRLINNTIMSNDTTASAGVLFKTIGAPFASTPPPNCDPGSSPGATCPGNVNNTSTNQPAGVATMSHTPNLVAALGTAGQTQPTCPTGYGYYNTNGTTPNTSCRAVSLPLLANNVIWRNRAFHVEVGGPGTGLQNTQNIVTLVPVLNQTSTGFCAAAGTAIANIPHSGDPVAYWDIGVRGDSVPTAAGNTGGYRLQPHNSILSSGGYSSAAPFNNLGSDPAVLANYCNGARLPPEGGGNAGGYQAPAGRAETTGLYPLFALNQAVAAPTVDEGNNWINLNFGPFSLSNASTYTVPGTVLSPLGDYHLTAASPAINGGAGTVLGVTAPTSDFYGTTRSGAPDIGAVEFAAATTPALSITGGPLAFGNAFVGGTTTPRTLTLSNVGTGNVSGISLAFSPAVFARSTTSPGTCGTGATFTVNAGASCTINVVFKPTAVGSVNGTLTVNAGSVPVAGSPVGLSGTGVAAPNLPALTVLDNFNRANATNLGGNWQQATVLGNAAIQINTNQASDPTLPGWAYWNGTGATFGTQQAAAFTFANATLNNADLFLKVTGTFSTLTGLYPNGVGVNYNAGTVTVSTYATLAQTVVATLPSTFANGSTMTAMVDTNGWVLVWNGTTYVGAVQTTFIGTGRIGMHLPAGARVDNFAGGTVP
jgi:hypothetical protein